MRIYGVYFRFYSSGQDFELLSYFIEIVINLLL